MRARSVRLHSYFPVAVQLALLIKRGLVKARRRKRKPILPHILLKQTFRGLSNHLMICHGQAPPIGSGYRTTLASCAADPCRVSFIIGARYRPRKKETYRKHHCRWKQQGMCHAARRLINSRIYKEDYYYRPGASSSKGIFCMENHTAELTQNAWNFLQEGERETILFFFIGLFKIFRFKIVFLNQIGKISSVFFSQIRRPAHIAPG